MKADDYQRRRAAEAVASILKENARSHQPEVTDLMIEAYLKGMSDISQSSSIEAFMNAALIGEVKRRGLAHVKQVLLETIVIG